MVGKNIIGGIIVATITAGISIYCMVENKKMDEQMEEMKRQGEIIRRNNIIINSMLGKKEELLKELEK